MDALLDLSLKIAVGAATAFIASYITVRLSLKRFYSQKWWEKKADAYSAIIESLHHMKRYFGEELDAIYESRELSEDHETELKRKAEKSHDELRKRADMGHFVLSEEAVAQLATFEKKYNEARDADSWHDFMEYCWAATDTALNRMRDIAKTDLKG
jgi:hypothetical protein